MFGHRRNTNIVRRKIISYNILLPSSCSEKTTSMSAVPAVETVVAWDGKDATIAVDEMPLDDLFADE